MSRTMRKRSVRRRIGMGSLCMSLMLTLAWIWMPDTVPDGIRNVVGVMAFVMFAIQCVLLAIRGYRL